LPGRPGPETKSLRPRPRAILFDFDGTLAPNLDLPDMRRQVIEFTRAHAIPDEVWAERYIVEIVGAGHAYLAQTDRGRADAYFAQAHRLITDIELVAARTTRVFSWTHALLRTLRAGGTRTAIVTRNCEAAVRLTFPELDELVDCLLARDNVAHLKPDPRHLDAAMSRLSTTPSQTWMVGDGAMDMRTGRAIGLYCIGVLGGTGSREQLEAAGAHEVLTNARALVGIETSVRSHRASP